MKKGFLIGAFVLVLIVGMGGNSDNAVNSKSEETLISTESSVVYEYDELQTLFISLTTDTTISDIESYISDTGLSYTRQDYNKIGGGKETVYSLAYTDGAALQKYADPGDRLKISFDKENDYRFMMASYCQEGKPDYSGLFYNYGTWYDFSEDQPGKYSGHYIDDSFGDDNGIVIEYDNGNSKKTNYFACDSAEDVIQKILKHD